VVFGSGSFGTALAEVLGRNGHDVCIVTRKPEVCQSINENHKNPFYFTEFQLAPTVTSTTNAPEALRNCDFIVHTIPVQQSFDFLRGLVLDIPPHIPIISASKGLHASNLWCMSELIPHALGREQPAAFFSGPSFAKELLQSMPTTVVVASADIKIAESVQALFNSHVLKVYSTTDVIGVEIGGALKNVFAIAAGIVEGMGFGMNSRVAIVTRGCHEMNRLAFKLGANPLTMAGLSGMGDLMLTCFGTLSRNRSVGLRLGKGETLEQILSSMTEVAEGVSTAKAAHKLAEKVGLSLPIIESVDRVLDGKISIREALDLIMAIPPGPEIVMDT